MLLPVPETEYGAFTNSLLATPNYVGFLAIVNGRPTVQTKHIPYKETLAHYMLKGCGYAQGDTLTMGGKTAFAKELFARWHPVEAAAQLGSARPRRYTYKGPLIPNGTPIPHPRPSCLPSTSTASYRPPVATSYAAAHVSPGSSTLQQPPLAFPTAPPPPPPPVPLAGIVIGATSGGCLQSPATATTPSRSRTSASPITNNLARQLKVLADALPVIYNTIVDMVVGTTPARLKDGVEEHLASVARSGGCTPASAVATYWAHRLASSPNAPVVHDEIVEVLQAGPIDEAPARIADAFREPMRPVHGLMPCTYWLLVRCRDTPFLRKAAAELMQEEAKKPLPLRRKLISVLERMASSPDAYEDYVGITNDGLDERHSRVALPASLVDALLRVLGLAGPKRTPGARARGQGTMNDEEEAEDKDRDEAEAGDKDEGEEDKEEDEGEEDDEGEEEDEGEEDEEEEDDEASSGAVKPRAERKKRAFSFREELDRIARDGGRARMEFTNERGVCVRLSADGEVVATRVVLSELPGKPGTSDPADDAAEMCEMALFQPSLNAMGGGIISRSSLDPALASLIKQRGAGAHVTAVVHVTAAPPLNKRGGVALSQRLLNAQLESILCADFLDELKGVEGQFIDMLPKARTTSTDVKSMSMSKTDKKDFKRRLEAVLKSNDPLPTVLVVSTAMFATIFAPHIPSTGGSCPVMGSQVYLADIDGLVVPVLATRHPRFADQARRAELRLPIAQTYALAALLSRHMADCEWTTLARACKHQVIATFQVEHQEVLDNIADCFTHASSATSRPCMTSYPSPPIPLLLKTAAQTIRVSLFFGDGTSQIADWATIAPFFWVYHDHKRIATVTGAMTIQFTVNADGSQGFVYGHNDASNQFKVNDEGLRAAGIDDTVIKAYTSSLKQAFQAETALPSIEQKRLRTAAFKVKSGSQFKPVKKLLSDPAYPHLAAHGAPPHTLPCPPAAIAQKRLDEAVNKSRTGRAVLERELVAARKRVDSLSARAWDALATSRPGNMGD